MRIPCEAGDYVSIERADPSSDDLRVTVSVRCRGFSGRVDAWIMRDVWIEFCQQLGALEQRRQGEATLESAGPKELRLTVRSTDRAGHMAIEGRVGYHGVRRETVLAFSAMSFDPSILPELVSDARAIGG